jgi:hypothetical protein
LKALYRRLFAAFSNHFFNRASIRGSRAKIDIVREPQASGGVSSLDYSDKFS